MIHTSESLKKKDGKFENYHYQLEDGDRYQLSSDELEWLDFVKGRYSIYDHIVDNSEYGENDSDLIYVVDTMGMSKALYEDGCNYKAVCLSEDTALQAIFFYSSFEYDEYLDEKE